MNKFAIRLLTLAMFSMALVAAPLITTAYAASDEQSPRRPLPPNPTPRRARRRAAS